MYIDFVFEQILFTKAFLQVGSTYDRKMIKGYVQQKYKVNISQRRTSNALQVAAPKYHQRRQTNTARLTYPIPDKADYFRRKLHIDQNEKLVMYGVTDVTAIDGHSQFFCVE